MMSTQITPQMLNIVCDKAARRAFVLAVRPAMLAVMVVPMFSPNTIAAPISNEIQPWLSMMSVIAIVADDDCTMTVRMEPISKKSRIEP